jgi:hypothetical protein
MTGWNGNGRVATVERPRVEYPDAALTSTMHDALEERARVAEITLQERKRYEGQILAMHGKVVGLSAALKAAREELKTLRKVADDVRATTMRYLSAAACFSLGGWIGIAVIYFAVGR